MSSYLIWSNEHRAWWRGGHQGYTYHLDEAGRYMREDAIKICEAANQAFFFDGLPDEVPVLEADAFVCMKSRERHRDYVEKRCADNPSRGVSDCIHCGEECRA